MSTQYFGFSVSNYRIAELVRDFDRVLAGGGVADDDGELGRAMTRVDERARLFFGALALARPATPVAGAGMAGNEDRVRVTAADLEPAQETGARALDALDALDALVALVTQPPEDLRATGRRAGEIRDELRFLLQANDRDYVYYLEQRGRGVFLRASPINVSSLVRNLLLDRFASAVLTSATLAVEGSFSYIRTRLGIERCEEVRLAHVAAALEAMGHVPGRVLPFSPRLTGLLLWLVQHIPDRILLEPLNRDLAAAWRHLAERTRAVPALAPRIDREVLHWMTADHYYDTRRLQDLGWRARHPLSIEAFPETVRGLVQNRLLPSGPGPRPVA